MLTQERSLRRRLLVLLALLVLAAASPAAADDAAPTEATEKFTYEANIDDVIDDNLDVIREGLKSMDPTTLKDIKQPLVLGTSLQLHDGILRNLAHLERAGSCNLSYINKIFTIDGIFGWNELAFEYEYLLKIWVLSRRGDVTGRLKQLRVNVVLDINFNTYQIILKQLDFIDAGKITIKLEGHLTDFIYNIVLRAVTWIGKGLVLKKIEEETAQLLKLDIDEINKLLAEHKVRPFEFVNLASLNRRSTDFLYEFDKFLLGAIKVNFE